MYFITEVINSLIPWFHLSPPPPQHNVTSIILNCDNYPSGIISKSDSL